MKVLILALIIITAGTALAQPRGGREKGKRPSPEEFIERLDKDNDGRVSKEEFDGPDEHFTQTDKNKDGYISVDEVPSGPPPR